MGESDSFHSFLAEIDFSCGCMGPAGVIKTANRCMVSCVLEPVGRGRDPVWEQGVAYPGGGTQRAAGKGLGWGGDNRLPKDFMSNSERKRLIF